MTNQSTEPNTNKEVTDSTTDQPSARVYEGPTLTAPVFGKIPLRPSEILKDLKIKKNPPLWAQFFKYGVCGVISTLVAASVWVIARVYYPEHLANSLTNSQLKYNMAVIMFIAFVLANLVAYFSNRIFVFTPGKHSFTKEMFLFFLVSATSYIAGNFAKDWFIDNGLHKDVAAASFIITSALVNFVARKYLVFSNEPSPDPSNSPTTI